MDSNRKVTDLRKVKPIPEDERLLRLFGIRQVAKYKRLTHSMKMNNHASVVLNTRFGVDKKEVDPYNLVMCNANLDPELKSGWYFEYTFVDNTTMWCYTDEFYAINHFLRDSKEAKCFLWYIVRELNRENELHISYK